MKLKIEASCEVDDLIRCVAEQEGLAFEEVEKAFFVEYIYPDGSKTCVGIYSHCKEGSIMAACVKLLRAQGLDSVYITYPI